MKAIFHEGVCDHAIKYLCRVNISRTVKCEFCGNQRSMEATASGLEEARYDDLLSLRSTESVRLLDIDHHQYMPGTDASMAPGFRLAEEQERSEASEASESYWAR